MCVSLGCDVSKTAEYWAWLCFCFRRVFRGWNFLAMNVCSLCFVCVGILRPAKYRNINSSRIFLCGLQVSQWSRDRCTKTSRKWLRFRRCFRNPSTSQASHGVVLVSNSCNVAGYRCSFCGFISAGAGVIRSVVTLSTKGQR